jgi:hypothetical protein
MQDQALRINRHLDALAKGFMRRGLGGIVVATLLALGSASAQRAPDPVQLYMIQLLANPDPALHARALREAEAAAPTFDPPTLYAIANQLARGLDYQTALRWLYFGELRLRTDLDLNSGSLAIYGIPNATNFFAESYARQVMAQFPRRGRNFSPELRRALFAQAVAMDQHLARSYAPDWASAGRLPPQGAAGPAWPAAAEIARSRTRIIAGMRTQLEDSFRLEALEDNAAQTIARGQIPEEAAAFLPAAFRSRLSPSHAIDLSAQCREIESILATAGAGRAEDFIVSCPSNATGDNHQIWIDASSGRIVGETTQPQQTFEPRLAMARGGENFLAYNGRDQDLVLLGANGHIEQLTPPRREQRYASFAWTTRSGRYAATNDVRAVLDLETNRWLGPEEASSSPGPQPAMLWSYLEEDASGAPFAVGIRRPQNCASVFDCPNAELVVRDVASGRERSVVVANLLRIAKRTADEALLTITDPAVSAPATPGVRSYTNEQEWRAHQAAHLTGPLGRPQSGAIANLTTMQISWRGPLDQAPLAHGIHCTISPPVWPLSLQTSAGPSKIEIDSVRQDLSASARASADACAVSSDGARIAISASPFLYVYEVRPAP